MQGHKSKVNQSNNFNIKKLARKYSRGESGFSCMCQRKHQLATPPSSFLLGFALFGCGGLMFGLVCPVVDDYAAAESTTMTAGDDTLSISVPTSLQLDLTPTFTGSSFATASGDVSVSTTNAYGYSLYISSDNTDNTGAATTSLINADDKTKTLPTLSAAVTGVTTSSNDNFTVNTYGFTTNNNGSDSTLGQVAANTYLPLTSSESATLIKKTETTASDDSTTVTFAAKAGATLTPGDYAGNITFTVSANPEPYEQFDGITTMQEMTATVCDNATTPDSSATVYDTDGSHHGDTSYVPQATLTDTRDNNEYTIAKLADGNCWMQENLVLGTSDSAGITLTANDSNVTSDWTLPAFTSIGTKWDGNTDDAYVIQGSTAASSSWTEDMGNWYTWGAATAGTAASTASLGFNTSTSVCPKGWRLPIGGVSPYGSAFIWTKSIDKSFGKLVETYGLRELSESSEGSAAFRSAPLSFSFAGKYGYSSGATEDVGIYGDYISSTTGSGSSSYYIWISSSSIRPLGGFPGAGYSVRCVAAD